MPKKIRELKRLLLQAGFTYKPAQGSHTKWKHVKLGKTLILPGKDGSDAKPYLEKQVQEGRIQLLGESIGRVGISSLLLFYPFEMLDGK